MDYTYFKLRGKIKEVFGSVSAIAPYIGVSAASLYKKLNGRQGWRQQEIARCCYLLSIPGNEIGLYFFTKEV